MVSLVLLVSETHVRDKPFQTKPNLGLSVSTYEIDTTERQFVDFGGLNMNT